MDNFINYGFQLTWTNNTDDDIKQGDVVIIGDSLITIAIENILVLEKGQLAIEGVWRVPKVEYSDIKQGDYVIWDPFRCAFNHKSKILWPGDISKGAFAFESAGVGDLTIAVKLHGRPGILG
jgi:predicted RecA/RadA family phage recombinase